MRKFKIKFYQFYIKAKLIYRIMTGRYKHFVVINLDEDNFTSAVAESLFDDRYYIKQADYSYHGMRDIQAYYAIMFVIGQHSYEDIIEMRARFQANADEHMLSTDSKADGTI